MVKHYSHPQYVALTIVPMATSALSLSASSIMLAMILRSKKKLQDAYRRLIFGLSVFDIFHSFAVFLKMFKTTPDPEIWATFGNQTSCDVLGFFHIIGMQGAAMYTVSLSIYYIYVIKYNMKERAFRRRVEPWLHFVPISWNLFVASFVVATDNMNPAMAGGCWAALNTDDCDDNDPKACHQKRKMVLLLNVGFLAVPMVLCLLLNIGILVFLWFTVRSQEKLKDKYRIKRVSFAMRQTLYDANGRKSHSGISASAAPSGAKKWGRTPIKSRDVLKQATWYAVAFLATHILSIISHSLKLATKKNSPFALVIITRIFQPLQGMFNVIVYTRPHVLKIQEDNPDLSWFKAFWIIVRQGGDDDRNEEIIRKPKRVSSREIYRRWQKSQNQLIRRTYMGDNQGHPVSNGAADNAKENSELVPQISDNKIDSLPWVQSNILHEFHLNMNSYEGDGDRNDNDDELDKMSTSSIHASEEYLGNGEGSEDSRFDILDDYRLEGHGDESRPLGKEGKYEQELDQGFSVRSEGSQSQKLHYYHNENNDEMSICSSGEDTYVHKNCELVCGEGFDFESDHCDESFTDTHVRALPSKFHGDLMEEHGRSPPTYRQTQECRLYATDVDEEKQITSSLACAIAPLSLDYQNSDEAAIGQDHDSIDSVREAIRRSLEDTAYGTDDNNIVI